jgi:F5/8 type C domain
MPDRRLITLPLFVCITAAVLGAAAPAWAGDLALKLPASASSTERDLAQFAPAGANDGNSATRWSSAYTDNQWWQVDLGSVRTIDRVELNWEVAYASRYRIRTRTSSSDPWSTAATVSIDSPGLKVHTFADRGARYVQIRGDARATPWGISLWDARVCDNDTCGASVPPPPPPPPPTAQLTLQAVDGGVGYYGLFSNPLPTDRSFFPRAVWGSYNHTAANRDLDAAAGINTYVWEADPCSFSSQVAADGRFHVLYEESENRSCSGAATKGWMLGDEVDMCCGPPGYAGGNGYQMLANRNASLPVDNRIRYTNYGKGVLWWESDADAARFVNLPFLGLVSADAYWMTDPNERGTARYGKPSSYGWNVDRMRYLDGVDGSRKPVWMLVETGWPFTESAGQGGRSITPPELRAAAWHSLIAGARGIIWFEHSFGGPCSGDHHTIRSNCEGTRPMVASVDAQIAQLAPVLNSPTVASGLTVGSGDPRDGQVGRRQLLRVRRRPRRRDDRHRVDPVRRQRHRDAARRDRFGAGLERHAVRRLRGQERGAHLPDRRGVPLRAVGVQ